MISDFKNAIEQVFTDFENRLKQQELFQIQTELLKQVQNEIEIAGYYQSEDIKNISLTYREFYNQLKGTGRSYENIIAEKSLVDTYSAFEKFLFDCFYALYEFHPKHLGEFIQVSTIDLLIESNIELCKKNIIELKVKSIIQPNNIRDIIDEFKNKKSFSIEINVSNEDKNLLYEVSLVRNLVIHNNSIVNRIYKEAIKKFITQPRYIFNEGDTIFDKLDNLVNDARETSIRVSEKIKTAIINDAQRLYTHHSNK